MDRDTDSVRRIVPGYETALYGFLTVVRGAADQRPDLAQLGSPCCLVSSDVGRIEPDCIGSPLFDRCSCGDR